MKKKVYQMAGEEKEKMAEMSGSIILWIAEGRSIQFMCDALKLSRDKVEWNIDEILYIIKRQVGIRRFIKILFTK